MSDIRDDGWRHDLEDRGIVKELAKPKIPKVFKSWDRPAEVRPESWHQLEDQGPMGSCRGNSLSSVCEQQHHHETQEVVQLSRIYAYLRTQELDGLLGSDRGATITNGVRVATEEGVPLESLAPYPAPVRYPNSRDIKSILKQSNRDAGAAYRIRSSVGIKSHKDALEWIGGGGSVDLGISWPPRIQSVNGRKTAVAAANGGGGHAIAGLGYKKNGNLIFANSHGYWLDITPQAFDQMLRHRWTVCIGLSGMADPTPRDLSYLKKSRKQRLGNVQELWA